MATAQSAEPTKPQRPAERAATRTGACGYYAGCKAACEAYEHNFNLDGFRTCACGHTQYVHATPNQQASR